MRIDLKLSSKFCPYCSNPKVIDISYQEIGCFSIMDKLKITGLNYSCFKFECENCGHEELEE